MKLADIEKLNEGSRVIYTYKRLIDYYQSTTDKGIYLSNGAEYGATSTWLHGEARDKVIEILKEQMKKVADTYGIEV